MSCNWTCLGANITSWGCGSLTCGHLANFVMGPEVMYIIIIIIIIMFCIN